MGVKACLKSPLTLRMTSVSKGVVGLTNIGNTCYGNATLQALRHQVDFTIFLLQNNHTDILKKKPVSEKTKLLEGYGELVKQLWTGETKEIQSRPFWGVMIPAAIKVGFEQFRIPIPHDAHEFLCFLLDQFHEAMAEQVSITIRSTSENPNIRGALEAWKRNFEKSYSPLVELVFGLQRKSVKCEECQHESVSWETMNMTKLSVHKSAEPLEMLDLMVSEGQDESIDGYQCDGCKKKVKATVARSLWRLGNWVIVVLKRNENSGNRINTRVNIPLTTNFEKVFHEASEEPSKRDEYELFATIHHHGSARGGHYTAHAKHPVSGKWAHYDDESAREVSEPFLDASTYIVMYRRVPK
jgi:ubiquitin C-terminal hydrolase